MLYLIFLWRRLFGSCECTYRPRKEVWYGGLESRREWVKGMSCMYHWMKTSYYKNKIRRA